MATAQEAHYRAKVRDPASWLHSAEVLRLAASLLQRHSDDACRAMTKMIKMGQGGAYPVLDGRTYSPQLAFHLIFTSKMLFGLALENLLKACFVTRMQGFPGYGNRGKIKWGVNPPHCLRKYAEKAGFTINALEARILDDLSDCVSWQGRYPVPMKAALKESSIGWQRGMIEALYLRIFEELRKL